MMIEFAQTRWDFSRHIPLEDRYDRWDRPVGLWQTNRQEICPGIVEGLYYV